jgi:lipoprotein LprG
MRRTRLAVALLALLAVTAAGCTSKKHPPASSLPPASQLLTDSANAMRDVQTVHVTIDVQGSLNGLMLHHADGKLTRDGKAQGTATADQLGSTIEFQFVIIGTDLYLKGPTGGFQKLPLALASTVYDPTAILDPGRGVVKLLTNTRDARTEAKETVDGHDAYRVAFTPTGDALGTLIPGFGTGATAKVWIATDSKRLLKAVFTSPAASSDKGATATILFAEYDAPVTINAP